MSNLIAQSLAKTYPARGRDLVILRDASLSLSSGESAAIMGPSGSGKSTLLNILGALEPPTSGTVTLDGTNPFTLNDRDLAQFRNRSVGFIFQDHHLLPQCSALENVLLPTLAGHDGTPATDRAQRLLRRVGLTERTDHRPGELSGGERQRVAICRALINQPAVLLADEPTGNLDRTISEGIADLLLEIHREEGTILVIVTHSDKLAARFQHRWELNDGQLLKG